MFQENRTPDNLFQGVPGADIARYGVDSRNEKNRARAAIVADDLGNLGHNRVSFVADYNAGAMNGWDSRLRWANHQRPYTYVPAHEAQPYLDMATQYVFGDRMFETQQSGSFRRINIWSADRPRRYRIRPMPSPATVGTERLVKPTDKSVAMRPRFRTSRPSICTRERMDRTSFHVSNGCRCPIWLDAKRPDVAILPA